MASALGVHASDIKTVAVYEGSLIINYLLFDANDDPKELAKMLAKKIDKIAKGEMNFGAPLLDATADGIIVVQNGKVIAPGYDPIILTKTNTNGDTGNSGSGSSSSSGDSGLTNEEKIYNVITGTLQDFKDNKMDHKNPFSNIEVLPQEIQDKIKEIQESSGDTKQNIYVINDQESSVDGRAGINENVKKNGFGMIMIGVIGTVVTGITIFFVIALIKKLSHPNEGKPVRGKGTKKSTTKVNDEGK